MPQGEMPIARGDNSSRLVQLDPMTILPCEQSNSLSLSSPFGAGSDCRQESLSLKPGRPFSRR